MNFKTSTKLGIFLLYCLDDCFNYTVFKKSVHDICSSIIKNNRRFTPESAVVELKNKIKNIVLSWHEKVSLLAELQKKPKSIIKQLSQKNFQAECRYSDTILGSTIRLGEL